MNLILKRVLTSFSNNKALSDAEQFPQRNTSLLLIPDCKVNRSAAEAQGYYDDNGPGESDEDLPSGIRTAILPRNQPPGSSSFSPNVCGCWHWCYCCHWHWHLHIQSFSKGWGVGNLHTLPTAIKIMFAIILPELK